MKLLLPVMFAVATALFWGLYGPILAKARTAEGSPFKPYVMIGVAYLVIGIFGGIIGMLVNRESFEFTGMGVRWGLAAGVLGALGALTLTWCMFSGGSRVPHAMMPIVFGGAVAVTALYTVVSSGGKLHASPMLWVGIVGMLISIVIITTNTPHPSPAAKPGADQAAKAAKTAGSAAMAKNDSH
jgi:hypothetical protein